MPCFLSALRVEKIGPREWRLIDDLVFESVLLRGLLIAPIGATTDFSSVPWFAWLLVPPTGQHDYGGAMHDCAYRGTLVNEDRNRVRLTRKWADRIMDEANEAAGVAKWQRTILYRGVRIGGGPHYRG